jgi:hypothetical protein
MYYKEIGHFRQIEDPGTLNAPPGFVTHQDSFSTHCISLVNRRLEKRSSSHSPPASRHRGTVPPSRCTNRQPNDLFNVLSSPFLRRLQEEIVTIGKVNNVIRVVPHDTECRPRSIDNDAEQKTIKTATLHATPHDPRPEIGGTVFTDRKIPPRWRGTLDDDHELLLKLKKKDNKKTRKKKGGNYRKQLILAKTLTKS